MTDPVIDITETPYYRLESDTLRESYADEVLHPQPQEADCYRVELLDLPDAEAYYVPALERGAICWGDRDPVCADGETPRAMVASALDDMSSAARQHVRTRTVRRAV